MTFVDQEIAHLTRAIALSLRAPSESGLPVFPAVYWRDRLCELMDRHHLQHSQLCAVDALLCELERVDVTPGRRLHANTAA